MGRAIVREPEAFLMDEPLSNLDAKLRVTMRAELARLHARLGTTTVYVTHDQIEAMTLGQRVAVLRDGILQQCAPPAELFHQPVNLFCASFIGSPQINLVEASITDGSARFAGIDVPLPPSAKVLDRDRAILGIRPSDLVLASTEPDLPRITARVDVSEDLGAHVHISFALDADRVAGDDVGASSGGEDVRLIDDPRAVWRAELPDRYRASCGDVIELAVRTDRFHAFDPVTGLRIG